MGKSKIVKLGTKILQADFPELFHRGKEAIGKIGERHRAAARALDFERSRLKPLLHDPELLEKGLSNTLKGREYPRFFFNTRKMTDIGKFAVQYPQETERTIKIAEEILRDNYPIFGDKFLDFGDPPDWFYDPLADKRSGPDFYDDIPYLDYDRVGDSKIVWELSRLKFIYPLGMAYLLTGIDRYALKAFGLVEDWLRRNQPKTGINWSSSLECAFRIYALVWMIELFRDIEILDNRMAEMIAYNVYQHADHIGSHLSYYFSPNTHLTGEAFGLFVAGLFFPEYKRGREFRDTGLQILKDELNNQFTDEGVHAELSSYYHQYSADFYMHTIRLCRLNDIELEPEFIDKTRKMVDYLDNLRRPDGLWPQTGDSDGGKLVWLEFDDVRDYSAVLSNAALLFERPSYYPQKSRFESAWLFGFDAVQAHEEKSGQPGKDKSIVYEQAGYAILRSEDLHKYLLFDIGKFGFRDCVHSHADALNIEFVVGDHPVFIDPGTYCYTMDKKMRDYFRSARCHNIALVNDKGCADPDDTFAWANHEDVSQGRILLSKGFDYVDAHYIRKAAPEFKHERSVFRVADSYVILYDRIEKAPDDMAKFHFHTPISSHKLSAKTSAITLENLNMKVILKPLTDLDYSLVSKSGQQNPPSGWYSPDYAQLEKITTLVLEPEIKGNIRIPFCIFPYSKNDWKPRFSQTEDGWWRIHGEEFTDFWYFGNEDQAAFVRLDEEDEVLSFALINTNKIEIIGKKLWYSEQKALIHARVEGKKLIVDGSLAGPCELYLPRINSIRHEDKKLDANLDGEIRKFVV